MKNILIFWLAVSAPAQTYVYLATGATPGSIEAEVSRFKKDIGELNPNEARSFAAGRREANWDGVGGTLGNDNFPGDAFTTARGLLISTPGDRLKVSGDEGSGSFLMEDVTGGWGKDEFATFSGQKYLSPMGSTAVEVEFRIPGSNQVACVDSFGAVFLDVDRYGQSYMEFYLEDGTSRKFYAPRQPVRAKGMSFVGVRFTDKCALGVRLVGGDHPIDEAGFAEPLWDGVGLDDFIWGEPKPIPAADR